MYSCSPRSLTYYSLQVCLDRNLLRVQLIIGVRVVQDEKNGTQPETLILGTGIAGRIVHVRSGQWTNVHSTNRVDVRHRSFMHRTRILYGVWYITGQVRVSHKFKWWRILASAVPSTTIIFYGGHTVGHRCPMAHILTPATHVNPGKPYSGVY